MPSSPGPPVLVLGEQVTALGALRSLARADLKGILVGSPTDFAARSRHCNGVIEAAETADPAALGDLLDRAAPAGAVVLPCSDTWSTAAARLSGEVRERFPTIVPPAEAQAQAVDKEAFAHLLQRCGLPHPETTDVRGPADLAPIARSPVPRRSRT